MKRRQSSSCRKAINYKEINSLAYQPSFPKIDIQHARENLSKNAKIHSFILCIEKCQLFRVSWDLGWGCTYRAIQSIYSALVQHPDFQSILPFSFPYCNISYIQQDIEKAWNAGIDEAGAATFSYSLQGKRDWIGAAEVAALLRFHQIDAQVHDFFLSPSGGSGASKASSSCCWHTALIDWVLRYFDWKEEISFGDEGESSNLQGNFIAHDKMPLFFQTNGHSTVIVGIVKLFGHSGSKESFGLALFDSQSKSIPRILPASSLKDPAYQIVQVAGIVQDDEKMVKNMILVGNRHFS